MTKVAVITDDGEHISAHFGRARYYKVFTIEGGAVAASEMRDKANHHDFVQIGEAGQHTHEDEHEHHEHGHEHEHGHGHGPGAAARHSSMLSAITDCEALLVRGMGFGAHEALTQAGIRPIITDIKTIEQAVQAYLEGSITDHPEKLH